MDRKVMERKGLWVKVIRVLKKRMQIKKYIRENDFKRIWLEVRFFQIIHLLVMSKHLTNGSPVWEISQLQIGLWWKTSHFAFIPQTPEHGSIHFWFMQALLLAHSVLTTHSGLHNGGVPLKLGRQEQLDWPFILRHRLLGPHGDGSHGFVGLSMADKTCYHQIVSSATN